MTEEDKNIMEVAIRAAVKEMVNGKIDRLSAKIDEHNASHEVDMAAIRPFMQGAAGLGLLWKILVGIGGILVIWVQIKGLFLR